MRPSFQKALAILLLVCAPVAWAGSSKWKSAKVLEVRDASETGASVAANNSVGVADTALVGGVVPRCRVTVAVDGISYSAIFPVDKHFKPTDLAEGEEVSARVEGNKLVLQRLDGKEMKAKIVHQGPVE
jgi:hypothetical protein